MGIFRWVVGGSVGRRYKKGNLWCARDVDASRRYFLRCMHGGWLCTNEVMGAHLLLHYINLNMYN